MNRAIAINGSPNKDGQTNTLLKQLDIPIFHLVDGIEPAYEAILKAEVVVFATPTLWYNVSALMKQLIEKMEDENDEGDWPCEGKMAIFVTTCDEEGGQQAINQMFAPLNHMGFSIPPYACYHYNNNMPKKSENQWMVKAMPELRLRLRVPPEQNKMGTFLCSSMLD